MRKCLAFSAATLLILGVTGCSVQTSEPDNSKAQENDSSLTLTSPAAIADQIDKTDAAAQAADIDRSAGENFGVAVDRINSALGCADTKGIAGLGTLGDLFICQTNEEVAVYVNQDLEDNTVASIKFIWNDYTQDVGYGTHVGAAKAEKFAAELGNLYALEEPDQLVDAIRGENNVQLESRTHIFTYTYRRGPSIDERMVVIKQK